LFASGLKPEEFSFDVPVEVRINTFGIVILPHSFGTVGPDFFLLAQIFYPDIGMVGASVMLSNLRLAPIQV